MPSVAAVAIEAAYGRNIPVLNRVGHILTFKWSIVTSCRELPQLQRLLSKQLTEEMFPLPNQVDHIPRMMATFMGTAWSIKYFFQEPEETESNLVLCTKTGLYHSEITSISSTRSS